MSVSATTALHCPYCGEGKTYRLEDGRMKCAQCAHKFTPIPRHSNLPEATIRVIAQRFWEMTPTTTVSAELQLNIKTVQRYFLRAREGMARCCKHSAITHFGSDRIDFSCFDNDPSRPECGSQAQPICAVVVSHDTLSLLFGDQGDNTSCLTTSNDVAGWLYGRNLESIERHLLDQMHLVLHTDHRSELPRQFWQFAKKGLARYQGGFRHNFPLFLREMEFRFKVRERPDAANLCTQLLIDHTTHQEN
jgi:uncharacterized Zn finger protein (UPF0148 family)